jgi:hypothetical protein
MEAAAKRLGFDISRKNWLERLRSESRAYPYTLERNEFCAALTPIRIHARMRALELIDGIMEEIEEIVEDHLSDFDEDLVELRARLEADPIALPVTAYIKQAIGRWRDDGNQSPNSHNRYRARHNLDRLL